ncbi:MAG: stage II sporulation protein M [Peptococcaceae bacterium]|nr:stage II sporulation protein M [Peptococcaceae bacterium]
MENKIASSTPPASAYTSLKTFHKAHRADWESLEKNLASFRGTHGRTFDQLDTLHTLYLKVSQHVSVCQTYFPHSQLTPYLNDLATRAHNTLYKGEVSSWGQLKHFFTHTFVDLFWQRRLFIALASLLFLLSALVSFLAVLHQPESLQILVSDFSPPQDPEAYKEALRHGGSVDGEASFSAGIMTNNIQVAILAFAGGVVTLGVFTVYMLILNGLMLGALACYCWQIGASYEFWAYILPHGIIELTAIFIAGGAGLLMGYKVLVPGPRPRLYQFKTQAAQSCLLLLGTLPLFVIAGIVEGFITPSPLPLGAKYIVAGLTVVALILYVALGKQRQAAK